MPNERYQNYLKELERVYLLLSVNQIPIPDSKYHEIQFFNESEDFLNERLDNYKIQMIDSKIIELKSLLSITW